jgi:hypothetical protein
MVVGRGLRSGSRRVVRRGRALWQSGRRARRSLRLSRGRRSRRETVRVAPVLRRCPASERPLEPMDVPRRFPAAAPTPHSRLPVGSTGRRRGSMRGSPDCRPKSVRRSPSWDGATCGRGGVQSAGAAEVNHRRVAVIARQTEIPAPVKDVGVSDKRLRVLGHELWVKPPRDADLVLATDRGQNRLDLGTRRTPPSDRPPALGAMRPPYGWLGTQPVVGRSQPGAGASLTRGPPGTCPERRTTQTPRRRDPPQQAWLDASALRASADHSRSTDTTTVPGLTEDFRSVALRAASDRLLLLSSA